MQDPKLAEMQIGLRKAQRQMKGVRLQYMDQGRIMFDDVAGIGDAKVSPLLAIFCSIFIATLFGYLQMIMSDASTQHSFLQPWVASHTLSLRLQAPCH